MDAAKFRALFDLTGRTAIITGGTRGIGRAIAEGFTLAGANVVVASRKAEACVETVAALESLGGSALGVPTHMGETEGLQALVDATVERFGGVDIVVNNAANALTEPLATASAAAYGKSFDVNVRGPLLLSQAAYPHLVRSEHASIINVISVGAITWSPGMALYSAAKSALLSFTRNLAAEWATDGIRVNALAPGTVDTDMVRNNGPEAAARMASISFQRRAAHADEMVGPALLLASDAGSYVTGQMLVADGGYAVPR